MWGLFQKLTCNLIFKVQLLSFEKLEQESSVCSPENCVPESSRFSEKGTHDG